jgi:MFS family permease
MRRLTLMGNRDFMLLWSGEALSQLGSQASTVAFPLLVLALSGSAAEAGVVGLAKWLPLAVTALPAGMAADRFDRKRLMIGSDATRALLLASIPVTLWLGRPSFAQIAAVAFLDGCLFTVRYVAERGALPQVVPAAQLPDAVAQNEARAFAANIAGPPLGGLLFALARALPFAADACSYVISMGTVAATRASFQARSQVLARERWGGVAEGLKWLWRVPFFRSTALLFAAGNPLYTGLYLIAILLAKHHGASARAVGVMFAVVGAGGLLGALAASPVRRRIRARTALVGEAWLLACIMPLLFVVHSPVVIGLIVAAAEFPTPLANSYVSGHRIAATPDHLQGRVQAAGTLMTMSLAWLGPLAVGFAFQHGGPTTAVLLVSAWALALAITTTSVTALRVGPPAGEAGPGAGEAGPGAGEAALRSRDAGSPAAVGGAPVAQDAVDDSV